MTLGLLPTLTRDLGDFNSRATSVLLGRDKHHAKGPVVYPKQGPPAPFLHLLMAP